MSEQEPEGVTPDTTTDAADRAPTVDDVTKLQQALDKERESRRAAEKRARDGDGYRKRVEEIEESSKSELQRAVDAARKEGAAQAVEASNQRLRRAEARALAAASQFRDPSDAVAFLGDLSAVPVSPEGDVDTDSLKKALTELAKQKPYLLVEERPSRPGGDAGQGPRPDGPVTGPDAMNAMIRAATGRA